VMDFLAEIAAFIQAQASHPRFAAAVAELGRAQQAMGGTLGKLLEWGQAGELTLPPLMANRVLDMMSELAVGRLLLEGAVIAHDRLSGVGETHPDRAFYLGKCHSAVYFALNVLPGVRHKAEVVALGDKSAVEIPDEAFATL
jgi:hypothetical protein